MKTVLKKGYVTLISTLIVGTVGLAIAISLLLLGLSSSRTSLVLQQADQAKALVNACAEDALELVSQSTSYSGSGSQTISGNTCTYTVTKSGNNTSVSASGTVGTIVRKVSFTSDASGTSWQEIQ